MGGRKLFVKLEAFLAEHQIKLGRDAFFDLLQRNSLLVRRKKRRVYTTQSFHWFRKYPNKIKEMKHASAPNQIWVSDITYWKIESQKNIYISLITDSYSRKIVGYHAAETLETVETIQALQQALKDLKTKPIGLIHHSDRGIQYCSNEYVDLLKQNQVEISMTENGDPYENALAERVNGILKEEYLNDYRVDTIDQAKLALKLAVDLYNNDRPHLSCNYHTPQYMHTSNTDVEMMDNSKTSE